MLDIYQKLKTSLFSATLVIPIAIFSMGITVFWGLMIWHGCEGLDTSCWKRWDSSLYLEIAERGYTLFPCPNVKNEWCGNAGWAPLYPFLSKGLAIILSVSVEKAAFFISNFAFLSAMLLAAKLLEVKDYTPRNWFTLLLFAFFPGCVYYLAIFPVSLTVVAYLLVFSGLKQENFYLAGIGAAMVSLSYSSGFFITFPLFAFGMAYFKNSRKFYWIIIPILSVLLATGCWFLYFQIKLGHWNALFLVQEKYGHGIYSPLKMLIIHLEKTIALFSSPQSIIEFQTVFVFLLAIFFLIDVSKKIWHGQREPMQYFQLGYVLIFWFVPFSMGPNISLYRGCIFLAPLVLLQKDKPLINCIFTLIIFLIFMVKMTHFFFDNTLI